MGQKIKTKEHQRACPCPKKPPIPKTGGPLHVKPWPIPDYSHKRRQYFGRECTDVTETMREQVPLHALHPNLVNAPVPFHNRRATSVTEYVTHAGKPRTGPLITTDEVPFYGTKGTSVTSHLRYVPPGHPANEAADCPAPFYGIQATDVTGPHTRAEPTITSYMYPYRSKYFPAVIFPQHVSPSVLVNAITERRRMYLERERPPAPPNSAREPERPTEDTLRCSTARSEPGGTRANFSNPPSLASTPRPRTSGEPLSSHSLPSLALSTLSARAVPPSTPASTPRRPKTASDGSGSCSSSSIQIPRSSKNRHKMPASEARPQTTPAASLALPRSLSGGSTTSRSDTRSTRSSRGSPASLSSLPQSSRASNAGDLASRRLGTEKLQRIYNWSGYYDDLKPRMAWR